MADLQNILDVINVVSKRESRKQTNRVKTKVAMNLLVGLALDNDSKEIDKMARRLSDLLKLGEIV